MNLWKSRMLAIVAVVLVPAALDARTRLRVAHLAPDAPPVDVSIDGATVLTEVPFLGASDYLDVEPGEYRVQVAPAEGNGPDVIDAMLMIESGVSYTVAATGLLGKGGLEPTVFEDNSVAFRDEAQVRFIHTSPDAPPVDIALAGGGVLFEDVEFRESSDYISVAAGTYDLEVRLAGTSTVALPLSGVRFEAGYNYNVYAVGLVEDSTLSALTLTSAEPILLPPEVRVAHLSPDAPNVDVWVDGSVVLSNVPFGAVSNYLELTAGTYNIQVTPTGLTEPVVIDENLEIENGRRYTVAATGLDGDSDLQASVYVDLRDVVAMSAQVRFIHASPDAPPVDIAVADGPILFADVEFRESSDYLEVMPGSYDLEVRLAGTDTVALSLPSVSFSGGSNVTVFAIGLVDDSSLGALPVVDIDGVFLRGDSNRDGNLDISDPVNTLLRLFVGPTLTFCGDAADADDDGHVSLTDAVYTLNFLFRSGSPPAAPYPEPGIDPTLDSLSCEPRFSS